MVEQFSFARRFRRIGKAGLAIAAGVFLTSCTGTGGGWLPPTTGFQDRATLGFSFSCRDASQSTQLKDNQTGRLHIELQYNEQSTSGPLGGPFSIHGVADTIDPVLESAICVGQNPPPFGKLIFFGVYRPTSSSAGQFPDLCNPTTTGTTTPQCRFEVQVTDSDGNRAPSQGDFFSITLSGSTTFGPNLQGPLIYHREGTLGGGNIQIN